MKKSTVMLWAIFGALLMGCSDEEIANVETSSRNAIGFNVLSNAAETRATPTTNTNLKNTDFDVFAFTADGTAFMGLLGEGERRILIENDLHFGTLVRKLLC